MDEFKKASTLHEEYGKKDKPPKHGRSVSQSFKSKTRKCEHHTSGLCEVSREAFNLGLAKAVFPCTGNIPPDCKIRQDLAAGKTIQEIYAGKSRE